LRAIPGQPCSVRRVKANQQFSLVSERHKRLNTIHPADIASVIAPHPGIIDLCAHGWKRPKGQSPRIGFHKARLDLILAARPHHIK